MKFSSQSFELDLDRNLDIDVVAVPQVSLDPGLVDHNWMKH